MHPSEDLESASYVSVTFEFQKNRTKFQTISQQRSGVHLCPVKCWARLIKRLASYHGHSGDTPVNVVLIDGKLVEVSDSDITVMLRSAVRSIGEASLGFRASEVSTHSIRSSTTMALLLSRVDVSVIMLLGRWKSASFMRYVREQVLECLTGVSFCMANQKDFFTASHALSLSNMTELRSQLNDPATLRLEATDVTSHYGPHSTTTLAPATAFRVWA